MKNPTPSTSSLPVRHSPATQLCLLLLAACLPACSQTIKPANPPAATNLTQSLHERLTAAAWTAFNSANYPVAITNASNCVEEFQGAADRQQEKLKGEKATLPVGAVSEVQKKKTLDNGPLNDVATCHFIKGRSLERLGKSEEAKKAYEGAKRLSYGRCWDEGGWFWSPAEAAEDRLRLLK